MSIYTGFVYPLVLVACAVLLLAGVATLIQVRLHEVLKSVVTGMWIVTALQLITIVIVLLAGLDAPLVLTLGYLLATVMVLPLLGIGRLGEPAAVGADPDPERPVLQPDQIARVDAGAAVIISITAAVLAWRLFVILGAA